MLKNKYIESRMVMKEMTAVILAAGQGTRMKSDYPKVLHSVCGVPMVKQVIRVATESGFKKCVVITGFKEKYVREAVGDLSLIHISEPTRPCLSSRMPSSA